MIRINTTSTNNEQYGDFQRRRSTNIEHRILVVGKTDYTDRNRIVVVPES